MADDLVMSQKERDHLIVIEQLSKAGFQPEEQPRCWR